MQLIDVQEPYYEYEKRKNNDPPYVGITGFTKVPDITRVMDAFYKHRRSDHVLMAGILLSNSVLVNGVHPDKKKRYPPIDDIPGLLDAAADDLVMRTMHYNTRVTDRLYDDVVIMMKELGWNGLVDAFQFNVEFPPPDSDIIAIITKYPGIKIIVQVNARAMKSFGLDGIGKQFSSMADPGNYVLIDPSGGKGSDIDIERSMEYYKIIKKHANVVIGFAGGFSQHNVESRVKTYMKLVPEPFCIDAEGRLRTPGDDLDVDASITYIKNFFEAVSPVR